MQRKCFKMLLLVLASSLLWACSPLKPLKSPAIKVYGLNPPLKAPAYHQKPFGVLMVLRPSANPGYTTSGMIYLKRPYELDQFAKNRWTAPPAVMIQPLLVDALRNSGLFHSVVDAPFTGRNQWQLRIQIHEFHQSFRTNPSLFNFRYHVDLIHTVTGQVVAGKTLNATVPAPSNTPYGGVIAANQATAQLVTDTVKFLHEALLKLPNNTRSNRTNKSTNKPTKPSK